MNETIIVVKLKTLAALHIGGSGGDEVTDDLLRRDAQGRLFIPGSAVAGPLRSIVTRLAPRLGSDICKAIDDDHERKPCRCWVCELFGDVKPQEESLGRGDDGGRASALWIYDAYDSARWNGPTSIRDGVGIDRPSGAAARQGSVKFDLEVLPEGAKFDVHMTLQAHPDRAVQERNEKLLAVALAEWQGGRGTLGGRVARGLGGFEVTQIEWYERKLDTSEQLMDFLSRQDDQNHEDNDFLAATVVIAKSQAKRVEAVLADLTIQSAPSGNRRRNLGAYAVAHAWAQADITLQFQGPMLINDLTRARRSGFDHAPWKDGPWSPNPWGLPGSSVRGVLRSQAEKIARTLVTQWATGRDDFLVRCPAGDPNNSRRAAEPLANSDCLLRDAGVPGKEVVTPAQLDLADQLFGSVRMGSRLIVEDGRLANQPLLKALDFLAIDRFTGGGRDSAKFDAVALWQPAFRVRLRLDNPTAWELGWLLLTLRDLHDGLTTVGFGAAKGFGVVQISSWSAKLGFLLDADFPGDPQSAQALLKQSARPTDGLWRVARAGSDEQEIVMSTWRNVATDWIQKFNTEVEGFRRSPKSNPRDGVPCLQSDSYFNGRVDKLYPKEVIHHG